MKALLTFFAFAAFSNNALCAVSDSESMAMITRGSSLTQVQNIHVEAGADLVNLGTPYKVGNRTVTCILVLQEREQFGRIIRTHTPSHSYSHSDEGKVSISSVWPALTGPNPQVSIVLDSTVLRSVICYAQSESPVTPSVPTIGELRAIVGNSFQLNLAP
jgi:hypothetical protein